MRVTVALLVGLCLLTCSISGCSSGERIASTNDQLRLERETQRERIEQLEAENVELRAKLTEANARTESPLPADVIEALPRVSKIELTRFCSLDDGKVTWALKPTDGRGRFVQVVGTLELRAVSTDAEPRVLAETVLSPTELRDAFTSGLAGAGYRVSRTLEGDTAGPVTFTATLHDHVTGIPHEASRIVESRAIGD